MRNPVLTAVAWPYANGPRHIGHVSGFGVPSDIFARYQRMAGNRVLMVSGTDEHGTPISVQADQEGLTTRELADKLRSGLTLPPDVPQSLDVSHISDNPPFSFPNGCHVAEVEIVSNPVTAISRVNGDPSLTISITKNPASISFASAYGPSWIWRLPSRRRTVVAVSGGCRPAPAIMIPDSATAVRERERVSSIQGSPE